MKKFLFLSFFVVNLIFADRNNYKVNVYELRTQNSEEIFSIIKGWKIEKSREGLINFLDGKFLIDKSEDVLTQQQINRYQEEKKIRFVTCQLDPLTDGAKRYGFTFIAGMELYCDAKQYPVYAYASTEFIQNQSVYSEEFLKGFNNQQPNWTSGINFVFFNFFRNGEISSIYTYDYDYLLNSIGGGAS